MNTQVKDHLRKLQLELLNAETPEVDHLSITDALRTPDFAGKGFSKFFCQSWTVVREGLSETFWFRLKDGRDFPVQLENYTHCLDLASIFDALAETQSL